MDIFGMKDIFLPSTIAYILESSTPETWWYSKTAFYSKSWKCWTLVFSYLVQSIRGTHTGLGLGTHKNKWGNFWVKHWAFSQLHRLKTGASTLSIILFASQHCPLNIFIFQYIFNQSFFCSLTVVISCLKLITSLKWYKPTSCVTLGKTLTFSGAIFFMQHLLQVLGSVN